MVAVSSTMSPVYKLLNALEEVNNFIALFLCKIFSRLIKASMEAFVSKSISVKILLLKIVILAVPWVIFPQVISG